MTVLDAQGVTRLRVVPSEAIPEARMVNVHHAEAQHAALFVSAVTANDRNQYASFILRYDLPQRKLARVIQTNPIECMHLTSDAASIWCLGGNAEHSERSSRDFHLLYRFSHDGILQDSAFNWLRTVPHASRPWGFARSGPPALVPISGGVRVWLPNAGRIVTWRSGQEIELKEIPAALVSSESQDVVDTGRLVIVSSFLPPSGDRFNRARKVKIWDGDAMVADPASPLVPMGRRIVGRIGSQLLFWDRDGQRLEWVPVDWIQ